MSKLEEAKARKRKELINTLELKKKELQSHFDEGANKAIEFGKGMMIMGTGALLVYIIVDRYLESKFKTNPKKEEGPVSETKASINKLLFPVFAFILQQSASSLFSAGQGRLIDYLESKNKKDEHIQKSIPTK